MYYITSVVFDKNKYSYNECIDWLIKSGFSSDLDYMGSDEYHKFRQVNSNQQIFTFRKFKCKEIKKGIIISLGKN